MESLHAERLVGPMKNSWIDRYFEHVHFTPDDGGNRQQECRGVKPRVMFTIFACGCLRREWGKAEACCTGPQASILPR